MKVCKLFGASAVVAGIKNAVPLVHSPCGCQFYIRAGMVMHDRIDSKILCSDICQNEVIYGGEDRLVKSVYACQEAHDPDLIVLLSSCAPSLVGDDLEAVANMLRDKVRADIIAVDSAGFRGDQVNGFKDVLLKLIEYYARDNVEVKKNSVNLIGIIPGFDYRWRSDILSLINTLATAGIEVNTVLGGFNSLEQIKEISSAALNIVLSDVRGIEIAEYLKSRFGTPYVNSGFLPIGMQNILDWIKNLSTYLEEINLDSVLKCIDENVKSFEYAQLGLITNYTVNTKVAIVNEPYRALALAKFLTQEIGVKLVAMCITESNPNTEAVLKDSLIEMGQEECKILLSSDAYELNQALKETCPSIIYGSSFEELAAKETGASLIKSNYPVYDQVIMTERPYMGIKGIPVVMEDLINAIIKYNY